MILEYAYLLWVVFGLVWFLDTLRLRARLDALQALAPSEEPVSAEHRFLLAPGVVLDEATRRAASAHARAHGLSALDLVPGKLQVGRLLGLVQLVDFGKFRKDRLAKGRTAGHAILATAELLERARIDPAERPAPRRMLKLAARIKQHACTATDFAVAPGVAPTPDDIVARRAILEALFGDLLTPVLLVQLGLLAAAGAGPLVAPLAGGIALALFQLQPLLATLGRPLRPGGLLAMVLLRVPLEAAGALLLLAGAGRPRGEPDPIEAKRPAYEAQVAAGTGPLHEPRREDCPLCGGRQLSVHLRTTDLLQRKPGSFTVERCAACGHLFQNPRLSIPGLGYYYGDFYDGLGEDGLEAVFAYAADPYLNRAGMVRGVAEPKRWLDVGTGHGHFCSVAREVWPATRFDGLDLSESIEDAKRRGWVDEHFRGLFPELAPELAKRPERYDAVSMSHYLEHTREPKAELAAAAQVLGPGGLLLIEVPDPGSPLGKLLGRLWIPWFQPQHQHFVSVENLTRLFAEAGFTPVKWHRAEAHQPVDFLFAVMLLLGVLSPQRAPWRPRRGLLGSAWNRAVWWGGAPFLLGAVLVDRTIAPLVRSAGWSNTYRVLARRE